MINKQKIFDFVKFKLLTQNKKCGPKRVDENGTLEYDWDDMKKFSE